MRITDKLPPQARGGDVESGVFVLPAPDVEALQAAEEGTPAGPPLFGERATTRPATRPATQPATSTAPTDPGERVAPARPPVIVAVDEQSNSLIISAPQTQMFDIQSMVERLTATAAAGEAELKVFKVQQADPVSLARTLNELFRSEQKARPKVKKDRRNQQTAEVAGPKTPVTIVAERRTRSLIVRARPIELDMIGQLIEELDRA